MAMPASGSIAIISAPQACGSICAAVGLASGSLSALSVAAGKIAPHAMSEFYGYTNQTNVNIQPISVACGPYAICCCGCLQPGNSVPVGDCYFPNYSWQLCASNITPTGAFVCIKCNGTTIYQCSVSSKAFTCSGTWTTAARCVDYNDLIHIVTCVSRSNLDDCVRARLIMTSITQGVGTYCVGSPNSQSSEYGILPE